MVLRVCRRQLRDGHDAEDAFQATFLVLARRAGTIRKKVSVGPWLHGVAYRVARRLREQRRTLQTGVADPMAIPARDEPTSREELGLLDQELCALPAKYRTPVILYYLQGYAQIDVAAQLRLSLRTLEYRLARGRELLRRRLARRGAARCILGRCQRHGAGAGAAGGLHRRVYSRWQGRGGER
jgi:RNA polymerase sigma factor (sigma-70 family)